MDGSAFKLAFTISDISRLVFGLLDPTSRALAACVCKAWRAALPLSGGAKRRLVAHVMAERPELMNWALGPEPKIISTPRLYEIVVAQGTLESAQCLAARPRMHSDQRHLLCHRRPESSRRMGCASP